MDDKITPDQKIAGLDKDNTEDEGSSIITTISETSSIASLSPSRKLQMRHFSLGSSPFARRSFGLLTPVQQKVQCTGDDDQSTFSIYGNEVFVLPSDQKSPGISSSNKVRIGQVCKFDWEQRYYFGNLVSCNKTYVAYVVGAKSSADEHVRVINHHTSARALLKGFKGKVADLAFKGQNDNNLACIDSYGNLLVFDISEEDGKLKHELLLRIERNGQDTSSEHNHVTWEPGVIKDDETETETLIAVTLENIAEVYSLKTIFEKQEKEISRDDVVEGVIKIENGHAMPITNLTISPDLCVVATWSLDGFVKFWGLNFEEPDSPSLLHEWQPHDGEPVTSLFFCDNHLSPEENVSFWRFVITGSNYNTELKIWCAVTWKCLQVIRFDRSPSLNISSPLNPFPCVKACLDISASYLLLSDIKRQVLYVLQFYQNADEGHAHVTSLTEFTLAQPLLSFSICDTKAHKLNEADDEEEHYSMNGFASNGLDGGLDDADDDLDDSPRKQYKISLKLFGIHTKALQKLHITFLPTPSMPPPTPSICTGASSVDDQMSIKDTMSDITEGQGSIPSDQDEADNPVRLSSKTSGKVADTSVPDTARSGSSFTAVTGLQSPQLPTAQDIQVQSTYDKGGPVEEDDREDSAIIKSVTENEVSQPVSETGPTFPTAPFRILKRDEPLPGNINKSCSEVEDKNENIEDKSKVEVSNSLLLDAELNIGVASSAIDTHEVQEDLISSSISDYPESETQTNFQESMDRQDSFESTKTDKLLDLSNIESPIVGKVPIASADTPQYTPPVEKDMKQVQDRKDRSLSLSKTPQKSIDIFPDDGTPEEEIKEGNQIDVLISLLQKQQEDLQQLKLNVAKLTTQVSRQNETLHGLNSQQTEDKEQMKVELQLLHKTSSSQMSKAVKELGKSCNQRLEQFTNDMQTVSQQREEKNLQSLTQSLMGSLSGKLDKLIKTEVKISVLPALHKLVSPAMEQVTALVAQKLSAVEKILREETEELIKSKPVAETIGLSAATILEGSLPSAYREAFQNILLPAYERACQQMFVQINKAFTEGTKLYLERLETHLDGKRQKQLEAREPVLQQLQGLVQNFQATADQLTGSLESNLEALMEKQLSDAMARTRSELSSALEKKLTTVIFPSFKAELVEMLEKHKVELNESIRSIPSTPFGAVEQEDTTALRDRILELVEQTQYPQAFEQALTAADLNIVMLLCENVDPEILFSGDVCQLSQPIILSLIQQLSVDLNSDTDIKVRYLQQAIMALDTTNEVTAEHMPVVLGGLVKQLHEAIDILKQTDSQNKQITPLWMLLMATRGYVGKS